MHTTVQTQDLFPFASVDSHFLVTYQLCKQVYHQLPQSIAKSEVKKIPDNPSLFNIKGAVIAMLCYADIFWKSLFMNLYRTIKKESLGNTSADHVWRPFS